jgi:hypothetical protein
MSWRLEAAFQDAKHAGNRAANYRALLVPGEETFGVIKTLPSTGFRRQISNLTPQGSVLFGI